MSLISDAIQAGMKKALEIIPESWIPGGILDPLLERENKIVGTAVSRLDGRLKVTGQARFAAEFHPDHMTYAAVLFSTIPEGEIETLDTSKAEKSEGVVLVMTHENAPRLKDMPEFNTKPKAAGPSTARVLQDKKILWNGQPIAVVLAETQEQADHAKSLIRVTYQQGKAVTELEVAEQAAKTPKDINGEKPTIEIGDAEKALSQARHKVDLAFSTPMHNHNPIEPHAVTLFWKSDELHIHDASQLVDQASWTIGQVFGLKEDQVHISSPFVGGGFGSKCLNFHHLLAASASKLAGRPVRLTLSREGVYRIIGGRTATKQRVALGADPNGKLTSVIHTGLSWLTSHNNFAEPFTFPTRHALACPNLKIHQDVAELNMVANFFMRAPGEAVGTFALEVALDELAEKIGIDPIELRIKNEPDVDPTQGTPFSSRHIVEAYRDGAKRFGWEKRRAQPRAQRDGEWFVGMGCATATYPYYRMPGGAARITLRNDGSIEVESPSHEMGMGTATTQTMLTAERFGLPMHKVNFRYGKSNYPGSILAGGSSQTATVGAAIVAAQEALVAELLKFLPKDSPLYGLKPKDVETREGGLASGSRFEFFTEILSRAGKDFVCVEAEAPQPVETMRWSMHSHGAVFTEVRVNAVTGEIRVSRLLGSFDCGRIINPKTATSQFRGGMIMGLGLALMEETQFDERKGRIMNANLSDYHLPVHLDVPEIDVIWQETPDPHAPAGARGIGEIGITGVGAAVANAVYNACGVRVRDLPITLDKLLNEMEPS